MQRRSATHRKLHWTYVASSTRLLRSLTVQQPRNALSPHALSPSGGDVQDNPFEAEFNGQTYDEDDDEFDDSEFEEGDEDDETIVASNSTNFAVLNSSLPTDTATSPHHLTSYASAKQSGGKERKHHKVAQWHFGIRSRSPPMEIMLEIYKTLRMLGMEWKEKGNLGGLAGVRVRPGMGGTIERVKDMDGAGHLDVKAATSIYAVETRARVNDVVVRLLFCWAFLI